MMNVLLFDNLSERVCPWEVDLDVIGDRPDYYWAKKPNGRYPRTREWHWVRHDLLVEGGYQFPRSVEVYWQVDWNHLNNTGSHVMAKNPRGHLKSARVWHMVATGYLRTVGVNTPSYDGKSWEVNWEQHKGKKVMARNLKSKDKRTREWHWIDMGTLQRSGIKWQPVRQLTGKYINTHGYVHISRLALSPEDEALIDAHDAWNGSEKRYILEHRFVALKKYGSLSKSCVVRHMNGIKTDNRPENLVTGTIAENIMDHNTSRRQMMYWRERCEKAEAALAALQRETP